MFRKLIAYNCQYLKLCPLPRDKIGFVRTYADDKKRYINPACDTKGCRNISSPKEASKLDCKPLVPGVIRPLDVCKPGTDDPCNPQKPCCGVDRLKSDPCYQRRNTQPKKPKVQNELPKKSVWEYTADCCGNPCPDMLPRFDTIYYRMKDKSKAQYQQTWVECPYRERPKKQPCLDIDELPPLYRRVLKRVNTSACEFDEKKLQDCCRNLTDKCARIKMPGCRLVRNPPRCHQNRNPSDCKKTCCPFPAYSECCRDCLRPLRDKECECLRLPTNCDAYAYLKRKRMYNLAPNLPAWPPKMIPSYHM